MERVAKWALDSFGPWAATLLCLATAIWWLLRDRNQLIRKLEAQQRENRELREKYAKTLLGVSYRQSQAIAMLARARPRD